MSCFYLWRKKMRQKIWIVCLLHKKNKEVFAAMCNKIQGIHEDHFKIKSNMCCVYYAQKH